MARKCYISFKTEDTDYKEAIQDNLLVDYIDKSLNEPIDSDDEDYILQTIRSEYLGDSTVTIHLIGNYSAEDLGEREQRFIKRELQGSLYSGSGNTKNGILGVVLPDMVRQIYRGTYSCAFCGATHNTVNVNDGTTVKEFSYNYYIPNNKCAHWPEDRYCVLVSWSDFERDPEAHIEAAFANRTAPIAAKTRVYP